VKHPAGLVAVIAYHKMHAITSPVWKIAIHQCHWSCF